MRTLFCLPLLLAAPLFASDACDCDVLRRPTVRISHEPWGEAQIVLPPLPVAITFELRTSRLSPHRREVVIFLFLCAAAPPPPR